MFIQKTFSDCLPHLKQLLNMEFTQTLAILLIVICQLLMAQKICQDQESLTNQTFEVSMIASSNQTGHWLTQFLLDKSSDKLAKNWKVNLKQSTASNGGTHSLRLMGTILVPPPKPDDYELFQGVGYYKFHHDKKVAFAEALSICASEGGHLAIINSEEESNVIKTIYARHLKDVKHWSYIGFYTLNKAVDWVTIFGQPIAKTGFFKWNHNEPNNLGGKEYCGCILITGLFCDVSCFDSLSFFCEYDLSWTEL